MKNTTTPKKRRPEKVMPAEMTQTLLMHAIVYDRTTGRILETHRTESIGGDKRQKTDAKRLLKEAAEDPFTIGLLKDGRKESLAVLEVPSDSEQPSRMMVDLGSGKLVPKPNLQLSVAKTELEGDGKDSTEIEVTLVDSKGKRIPGFDSEIEIRTSRGKLSARGGRIKLEGGRATISLTSVVETVNIVTISARSLEIPCESRSVQLSFV